jgi:hypothetical protein
VRRTSILETWKVTYRRPSYEHSFETASERDQGFDRMDQFPRDTVEVAPAGRAHNAQLSYRGRAIVVFGTAASRDDFITEI